MAEREREREMYSMCVLCAGAFMVRRKKLWLLLLLLLLCALSNHQHYWLSELHLNMEMVLVASAVCASAFSFSINILCLYFSLTPKPIFWSVTHIHTSTFCNRKKNSNISVFRRRRQVQTYLRIFIGISHFNFVTFWWYFCIVLFSSSVFIFSCTIFPLSRPLLDVVFRIWFPLIGVIIAIQSSLWAFKVFFVVVMLNVSFSIAH